MIRSQSIRARWTRAVAPLALAMACLTAPAVVQAQDIDLGARFAGKSVDFPVVAPNRPVYGPQDSDRNFKAPRTKSDGGQCLPLQDKFDHGYITIDRSDDGKRTTGLRVHGNKIGVRVTISLGPHAPKHRC